MNILYLDLGMGAAGDMLSAALYELFPESERQGVIDKLNSLGIPKVHFEAEPSVKCGITGTHMSVKVDGVEEGEEAHEHEHQVHEHSYEAHEHTHEAELHAHVQESHIHTEHCHESEAEDVNAEEHEHDHIHEHDHSHEHEHEHTHEHAHGGHTHTHNSMTGITHIVNDHMHIDDDLRKDILAVYGLIAEAESHAHGVDVSEIHFHEVGNMDAIADVTAVSLMLSMLKPDRIIASPVNTGSGKVKCAHGIMPVPAPATAYLIQGIPSYDNGIKGELLTPTGAALIKRFADGFGNRPSMIIERTGYGMGKKDFEAANCVRAIWGVSNDKTDTDLKFTDTVIELAANIDDMTAEELGFASRQLLKAGALDVWTEPIYMKKQRPGVILKLLCSEDMRDALVRDMFKYTSTIGIRESLMKRYILKRQIIEKVTKLGKLQAKHVTGYGVDRTKSEYDDLAAIASARHISIAEARRLIEEQSEN